MFSELLFTKNAFLKDFRNWWLAALLFLFAMHMQSLKLHPPRIKSNSALRTLRQVLCSWRQVLCQCGQALCPATHKFLLPLVISAQWKGWKRKQSTAFIGLGMFCPVQKWHVETWNSDCEPSREYKIVSRQNMGWRNTTQQQQGQAWRLRSVHQQLPSRGPGTGDMPEALSFLEGTWSCDVFSKAYHLSEKTVVKDQLSEKCETDWLYCEL